jgi:hypothetical protein
MPTPQPPAQPVLVEVPAVTPIPVTPPDVGRPRLREVNRAQLEWRPVDLDSLLPDDHRARLVWEYVVGLDVAPLYARIEAVEGHAGAPATDPRLLLALWLQATLDGVGSARAGPPVRGARRLPVAVRRRLGELSHPRRLPHRPRRGA